MIENLAVKKGNLQEGNRGGIYIAVVQKAGGFFEQATDSMDAVFLDTGIRLFDGNDLSRVLGGMCIE